MAISNNYSNIAERYQYDIYGNTIIGSAGGKPRVVSAVGNLYLFTGRRFDIETGLYYYRARYYYPYIGRFLQTDPIGYKGGMNLYAYVGNNPIVFTDPLGLCGFMAGLRHLYNDITPTATGINLSGSTVRPVTRSPMIGDTALYSTVPSQTGNVYGEYNAMKFHEENIIGEYEYTSKPVKGYGGAYGLNVGFSAEAVVVWGEGGNEDWPGQFGSVKVNYYIFTASYFWSPDGTWDGFTIGFGLGLPGIAYEKTTYSLRD